MVVSSQISEQYVKKKRWAGGAIARGVYIDRLRGDTSYYGDTRISPARLAIDHAPIVARYLCADYATENTQQPKSLNDCFGGWHVLTVQFSNLRNAWGRLLVSQRSLHFCDE